MTLRIARRCVLASLVVAAGCIDDPIVPLPPCTGSCVAVVDRATDIVLLTPGDTGRLVAEAYSADGARVGIRWSGSGPVATVESDGLVRALAPGRGQALAIPGTDTLRSRGAEIWVVHPDTGGPPFITLMRNAATGEILFRERGFVGIDSIDLRVSYVLGRNARTVGEPAIELQVRPSTSAAVLATTVVPATVRGRLVTMNVRLRLTERDAAGVRKFATGYYNLFVLMRLADGRVLGDQTGYPVRF